MKSSIEQMGVAVGVLDGCISNIEDGLSLGAMLGIVEGA